MSHDYHEAEGVIMPRAPRDHLTLTELLEQREQEIRELKSQRPQWLDPAQNRDGCRWIGAYSYRATIADQQVELTRECRWDSYQNAWTCPATDRVLDPQPYAVSRMIGAPPREHFP